MRQTFIYFHLLYSYYISGYFEALLRTNTVREYTQSDAHLANPSRVVCHPLWRVERTVMVTGQETDGDSRMHSSPYSRSQSGKCFRSCRPVI